MARTHTDTLVKWQLMIVSMLVLGFCFIAPGKARADYPLQSRVSNANGNAQVIGTQAASVSPYVSSTVTDRATMFTLCGTAIPALSNLQVDVTETTATVRFDTCATMRATAIIYADVNPAPFANGQVIDETATTHHLFRFAGLPAGGGYRYRLVEMNGGDLQAGHFQTTYPSVTSNTIVQSDAGALEMSFATSAPSSISVALTALGPPDEAIVQPVTITFDGTNDQFWFRQPGLRAHAQYFWAIQSYGKTIKSGMFNT